ncbi:MAG: hypothetical protein E6K18_08005 [Methanobacteriota archaeon]|nr:MAG: hypothetical protein E6K18_08005 [Euryarchaeota archaeon]
MKWVVTVRDGHAGKSTGYLDHVYMVSAESDADALFKVAIFLKKLPHRYKFGVSSIRIDNADDLEYVAKALGVKGIPE